MDGSRITKDRAKALRRAMSLPEVLLWRALRAGAVEGLHFRKQHPIGPYVLDFYCHEANLCVEIDGQSHDFTADHDERRDRWLAQRGVRTLRISAKDVLENLEGVLQYIASEARTPSVTLRVTPPPEGEED